MWNIQIYQLKLCLNEKNYLLLICYLIKKEKSVMKNFRIIYFIVFIFATMLCGFSFYYNLVKHIPLCPLCSLQVLCFYLIAIVSLIRFVYMPTKAWRYGYAAFLFVISSLSALFAGRELWMYNSSDQAQLPCAPDVLHPFSNLTFSQYLSSFFERYNNCVQQNWHFLGLSMPMWSLLASLFLVVISGALFCISGVENEPVLENAADNTKI